jgi:hypothetical protein
MPLSQIFSVTTTELLSGKRIEKNKGLAIEEVEALMNRTIYLSKEEVVEQNKNKKNRKIIFFTALIILILELVFIAMAS